MSRRLRSAVATRQDIEQLSPMVRQSRAAHLVARDRMQRLVDAQHELAVVTQAHQDALALVAESAASIKATKATIAAIEAEVNATNILMAG
ncbi:hypothetical protein ABIB06_000498 [Bradyrhizobium sp. LB8.2]|uniref:hypothetical protein n=1 Tax=Bradyrhizobium sp. LB8.2 TaxID=3156330 RepID=UPI003399D837